MRVAPASGLIVLAIAGCGGGDATPRHTATTERSASRPAPAAPTLRAERLTAGSYRLIEPVAAYVFPVPGDEKHEGATVVLRLNKRAPRFKITIELAGGTGVTGPQVSRGPGVCYRQSIDGFPRGAQPKLGQTVDAIVLLDNGHLELRAHARAVGASGYERRVKALRCGSFVVDDG